MYRPLKIAQEAHVTNASKLVACKHISSAPYADTADAKTKNEMLPGL